MKHFKSIISLIVALCIVAAMAVTAFATEDTSSVADSSIPASSEAASSSNVVDVQSLIDANKIVKFETLDKVNFTGDIDKIASNGLLYANGKEVNTVALKDTLDLGNTWQVAATFSRINKDKNTTKNCLGEKYVLQVGEVKLEVGNKQAGIAKNVAILYFNDERIGWLELGDDISGTYAIRYTRADDTEIGKLYVIKDNKTMSWNVEDSTHVSVDTTNGVTSYYNIRKAAVESSVESSEEAAGYFSAAEVSITAAGNDSKDKTNYAYDLWIAKKFYSTNRTGDGTTGGTGTGSGTGTGTGSGAGETGKTGDMSMPIIFVLVALVLAGAGVVLASKKTCKE